MISAAAADRPSARTPRGERRASGSPPGVLHVPESQPSEAQQVRQDRSRALSLCKMPPEVQQGQHACGKGMRPACAGVPSSCCDPVKSLPVLSESCVINVAVPLTGAAGRRRQRRWQQQPAPVLAKSISAAAAVAAAEPGGRTVCFGSTATIQRSQ